MKKIFLITIVLAFITSCGSNSKGELVGVKGKKWNPEKPYGMSLVPGGAFIMGKSDDDIADVQDAPTRTVSVRSFYMDETEITNSEYRQFVHWVRDSILRLNLAIAAEDAGKNSEDESTIGAYAFNSNDEEDLTPYEKYMSEYYGVRSLNNDVDLILDLKDVEASAGDEEDEYFNTLLDMHLDPEQWWNGLPAWDVDQFKFDFNYLDLAAWAKDKGAPKSDYIKKKYEDIGGLNIYPDEAVWVNDFDYSYNEPMFYDYFTHEAYGDYPVVGITWDQAQAFCHWRTLLKNSYKKSKGDEFVNSFRLPSEAEWEYAARGGLAGATYPWGGPYIKNDRGCFMANFKPLRGNYVADQALYTVEADAYEPNDYNLYNMSGNVSEWVMSSYEESSYEYSSSINPNVNDVENKRKVVRGGSWKDVAYFLQVSSRDYEYADSARSYIGFRTVQDYMGTDVTANAATNYK
jgi:gliding motility-associated lipoprotein GldK